ncbi:MAG: hypothetical protein JSS27_06425 [Planctomycetes bacterium]|nr:hypothetical protein [Planctomycetota bacterium]
MKAFAPLLVLAAMLAAPLLAYAGRHHHCCPNCGCHNVKKICCLVPEVKKVPRVVYDCECEDFCVPGPSKMCGVKCVPDCDALHGCRKEIIWKPCCGQVRTRTKLVKKTVIDEKPGFKCVVKVICNGCGCNRGEQDCGEGTPQTQAMIQQQLDREELAQQASAEAPVDGQ